ncbi:serine protease [Nocardia sp. NBC_00416]|uniref:serine protease n=1 Tax=Nocardia sp. NBC_00416 TaxID=2975991 RepID=UPI002E25079C
MFRKLAQAASAVFAVALSTALIGTGTAAADPGRPVLGGGSGLIISSESGHMSEYAIQCTLTTIGRDGAGRLVGLTAGHCGTPGHEVYSEQDPGAGVLGRFVYSNQDLDYAVLEFDPGRVTPVNRVGNLSITGVGGPAQFPAIVCKEGRTTGNTCGIAYGDVFASSMETWSQMCVMEGDSGAPVVVGSTLVGMVNAYLAIACFGPEVGTNMATIMGDINSRGGVGSGYLPI